MTGGDIIAARYLHREFFEFRPFFKLWLAANHRPPIRETTEGIWRRMTLIPFEVEIQKHECDKQLPSKLKNELPGILNWAIEGCRQWLRDGLRPPACVTNATEGYRAEMDHLGRFIESHCELGAGKSVGSKEFYATYKDWADDQGEKPRSQKRILPELERRGVRKVKNSTMRLEGIALTARDTDSGWS